MSKDFECHITIMGLPRLVQKAVEEVGWSFSHIDGDPVLGASSFCYATNHYDELMEAKVALDSATVQLIGRNLKVLRIKIEHVVFDKRFNLS